MAVGDLVVSNFQYEFNGIVIGSGTDFITSKVEGLLATPQIKTTDFDRMDAWGSYPGRDMLKDRTITFTVDVIGQPTPDGINPIQTNYDNLMSALAVPDQSPPASSIPLVFLRNWTLVPGKRFLWGRPGKSAVVSDSDFMQGHFQIVFEIKCNDPRVYSLTQYTDTLTILNTTNAISGVVTNKGGSAASPVVQITGPAINPIISNAQDSGKVIALTLTMISTDILTIDMRQRTIMLNGSTDVSGKLNTSYQFWKLRSGANTITYNRTGAGAASTMSIFHNDTWSS